MADHCSAVTSSTVGVSRRGVLGIGLVASVAALVGCEAAPPAIVDPTLTQTSPQPDPLPTVDGVALSEALSATLIRYLEPTPENPRHPSFAGAVALVTIGGVRVASATVGEAVRYDAGPVLRPEARRVPMRDDSIFDLASLTKIYTSIALLRLVDAGQVDLAAPVRTYLPDVAAGSAITVAQLLTHTSGLPIGPDLSGASTVEQRWRRVLASPLLPEAVPGDAFRYSSVGLMFAGLIVERLEGARLDEVIAARITGPLGLHDTGFTPRKWLPAQQQDRLVATDARSSRGLLLGEVHDQVCRQLGEVAGHAGMFSTAADLAAIGNLLLNGGSHNGVRVLSASLTEQMVTNANAGLPAFDATVPTRTSDHGLGVVLNQPWFMGGLASPRTFGHTGFSGTSIVCAPEHGLVLVLLTNRAHPNWEWADPNPIRAHVATVVSDHLRY